MLRFACPRCQAVQTVAAHQAGHSYACTNCGQVLRLGHAAAPASGYMPEPARRLRKGGVGVIVSLAIVLVVLVAAAVTLLVWRPWEGGSPASEPGLTRFLPDNSQFVVHLDFPSLVNSEVFKKIARTSQGRTNKNMADLEENLRNLFGMGWTDMDSMTLGGQATDEGLVVIIKPKMPVQAEKLMSRVKGENYQSEPVNNYTVYRGKLGVGSVPTSFCVVDPNTVLFAGSTETLKTILQRAQGPKLPDSLKTALAQVNSNATIWGAMGEIPPNLRAQLDRNGIIPLQFQALLNKVRGATVEITTGSDIQIGIGILFADSEAAKNTESVLNAILIGIKGSPQVPPPMQKVMETFKVSASGTKLTVKGTINGELVETAFPVR